MSSPRYPDEAFQLGTGGHGPSGGYRAVLFALREYFRGNDPDFAARARKSPGSRRHRRSRTKHPLTPAQQRLMDKAELSGLTESALMDRLQARRIIPSKRVWLHELTPAECKSAFAKQPWK